jgi:hypothetical protein
MRDKNNSFLVGIKANMSVVFLRDSVINLKLKSYNIEIKVLQYPFLVQKKVFFPKN